MLKGARPVIPLTARFELTYNCNIRCKYCFLPDRKTEYLSTKAVLSILRKLYRANVLLLNLSGGELFARKDILQIYKYAYKKGFQIEMSTNGTLLNKELIDHFDKYRPQRLNITLRGATREAYKRITGSDKYFDKLMWNLNYLKEKNVNVILIIPMLNELLPEIPAMKALAARLGFPIRYNDMMYRSHHVPCDRQEYADRQMVSTSLVAKHMFETVLYKLYDDPRYQKVKDRMSAAEWFLKSTKEIRNFPTGNFLGKNLFWCDAGMRNLRINPRGELTPCNHIYEPSYSLLKYSINEALDRMYKYLKSSFGETAGFECMDCPYYGGLCFQCPGRCRLITGKYNTKIGYFCDVTHKVVALLKRLADRKTGGDYEKQIRGRFSAGQDKRLRDEEHNG